MDDCPPLDSGTYASLFRAVPSPCIVLAPDPGFTIIEANDAYLRATNRRREDVVGRPVGEVFSDYSETSDSQVARLAESLERVMARREADRMEVQRYQVRNSNGSPQVRYWAGLNVPVFTPQGELTAIIHRPEDLTEQIAATMAGSLEHRFGLAQLQLEDKVEAQLLSIVDAYRSQLYRAFQDAPAAIAVLRGPELIYELANDRYLDLVGHRPVLGRAMRDALPELEEQGIVDLIKRVHETGKAFAANALEIRLRHAPKPTRYFSFFFQPLPDIVGDPGGVFVLAFEVTELVQAQRHTEELADEARLANRRKDEFLAMLAHELRNPLAGIAGALALLDRAGDDAERTERLRALCERQVLHLTRLVDDLLDVSRITRGKIALRRAPLDLAVVARHAAQLNASLFASRGQALVIDVEGQAFPLCADRMRMEQVIGNLLTNAAKYTPRGGHIAVRIARETKAGRDWAVLEVADDGQGIPPESLPRIFDLFVQLDPAIDRRQGGLGIGLTLVRNLVEMHGGTVRAYSEGSGRGSTFRVRLPLDVQAMEQIEPSSQPHSHPTSSRRQVLIIEDNEDARDTLRELLQELGHEVQTASSGTEGLRKLLSVRPDVAIIDIGLPGMDGFEVARRARAASNGKQPTLIALSGYSGNDIERRAHVAGFDRRLVKPVKLEELTALLSRP